MLETIIVMLIYLALLALAVYLVLWVLGEIGLTIPPQVLKIVWVVVILVAVLIIVRTVLPGLGLKF